jgi:uncharacterized membrane protein HdeD (DUF308 family)
MAKLIPEHRLLILLQGLAAITFGVLAIFLPTTALRGMIVIFGLYAIVDGVLALLSMARATETTYGPRWMRGLQGVTGIVIGIVALVWPLVTFLTLLYLVALWAIIIGVLRIMGAVILRRGVERRWLLLVTGAIALIFGLAVVIRPEVGASSIMTIIGFFAVIYGVSLIALGMRGSTRAGPRPP